MGVITRATVSTGAAHSIPCTISRSELEAIEQKFPVFFQELRLQGASYAEIVDAARKIKTGSLIASVLLDINEAIPTSSAKNVIALVWYMDACAYQENNDVFLRGVVRTTPLSEEQGKRFKAFHANCSEAKAHNRPSSHFKELTVGHQKGLDFPKGSFPFDKDLSSLIFFRLSDGTVVWKKETRACSSELSISNIIETGEHLVNWVGHVFSGGGKKEVGGKPTRRETDFVPKVRESYVEVLTTAREIDSKHVGFFETFQKADRVYKMSERVETLSKHPVYQSHPKFQASLLTFDSSLSDLPSSSSSSCLKLCGGEVVVNPENHKIATKPSFIRRNAEIFE